MGDLGFPLKFQLKELEIRDQKEMRPLHLIRAQNCFGKNLKKEPRCFLMIDGF